MKMYISKKIKFILLLSFIFIFSNSNHNAHQWELGVRVKAGGQWSDKTITIYSVSFTSYGNKVLSNPLTGYSSSTQFFANDGGGEPVNAAGDIVPPYNYMANNTLPALTEGRYYLRIDNKYCEFEIENLLESGYDYDMVINYIDGSFSYADQRSQVTWYGTGTWTNKSITLRNNFGDDYANPSVVGKIKLDDTTFTNIGYSGTTRTAEASTFPHTISGEDNQFISTYYRKWRNWSDLGTEISKTLSTADNYDYTAIYTRKLDVTFRNYFSSSDQGGTIKLDDNSQNSPASINLYDDTGYKLEAANTTRNSVYYTFDHWEFNSTSIGTSNPLYAYEPTAHGILQAVFTGKPVNTYRYLRFNDSEYGQPVRLTWNKHPLDNSQITQYAVWRIVKHNGVVSNPQQIGTVTANGSASYSFTDYSYLITAGYTDDLLQYDVRAYYQPNNTYSDPDYEPVFGKADLNPNILNGGVKNASMTKEIPTEYPVTNYPNPFNPTTTINYQLPQDGMVTIKVYDMLGREVATLVNENKSAGYYKVNFDASSAGGGLTSGVYIYTIRVNNYTQSKKMLLMK